ncbi:RNA ligase 1 family protein [Methylobacterium sp. A54F]
MRKIPTIFERDWEGDPSRVSNQQHPACGWVFAGEGEATRKLDGTCCLVRGGELFKRREIRAGEPVPYRFECADADAETGKTVGWLQIGEGPEDRWHREAFRDRATILRDGTYELLGPRVQGNPEGLPTHVLMPHGAIILFDAPRTFDALRAWFAGQDIEGLVFHHRDGRMAKIKLRDFGLKRERRT